MEEELVSFQVAKLAKEKGFDGETQKVYDANETNIKNPTIYIYGEDLSGDDELYAPTQSLLQKWIREVHNINVYCIPCENDYKEGEWYNNIASHSSPVTGTYEQVLEVGLQEGLKLI